MEWTDLQVHLAVNKVQICKYILLEMTDLQVHIVGKSRSARIYCWKGYIWQVYPAV